MFFAKKQLSILENLMSFQNLKQDVRRLNFADGTQIKCTINHGFSRIDIYCPETSIQTSNEEGVFEFVIKPTFNGHYAVTGKQRILYKYLVDGEYVYKWLRIYGSPYDEDIQTVEGCSPLFEFETQGQMDLFKSSAVFYVVSEPPSTWGLTPTGATFTHFTVVPNPTPPWDYTDHNYGDEDYFEIQIGTGDGTVSPALYSLTIGDLPDIGNNDYRADGNYGLSTDPLKAIWIQTVDVNDNNVYVDFDRFGFLIDSDASTGFFNILTGVWETPIVFNTAIKQDAPIIMGYYKRNYADGFFGDPEDKTMVKRVDFKEADNTLLTANKSTVNINGKNVDAYELAFSDLKIMFREPGTVAQNNITFECCSWEDHYYCAGPGLYHTKFVVNTWGAYGSYHSYYFGKYYKQYFQNDGTGVQIPHGDWSYIYEDYRESTSGTHCSGVRRYEEIESYPEIFPGILSAADGKNPTNTATAYALKIWLSEFYVYDEIGDDSDSVYCENGLGASGATCLDPLGWIDEYGCPCEPQLFEFDYYMVDTPAEAF